MTYSDIWIRMPNWLGDFVMTLPHLRAIKKTHPHARLTLLAEPQFKELAGAFSVADEFISLPKNTITRLRKLFEISKNSNPETQLVLTNSIRGDIEARILGAGNRLGIAYPGKFRPLLTDIYRLNSQKENLVKTHQVLIWEKCLKSFHLINKLDNQPFTIKPSKKIKNRIGIIPGSSNNPIKCWPSENWCKLIHGLTSSSNKIECCIYGTPNDAMTSMALSDNQNITVTDMRGKTNLIQLIDELNKCSLVIGNDTGAMHLANAIGTPTATLFGPTNPLVTRPFLEAPKIIIQPENCPPEGGTSIHNISVSEAITKIKDLLC